MARFTSGKLTLWTRFRVILNGEEVASGVWMCDAYYVEVKQETRIVNVFTRKDAAE